MAATILVVEDSKSQRMIQSFTLLDAGYLVKEAVNGVEAIALAKETAFDLFTVDINMPELDGLGFISQLRDLPGYAETPVVVITTESSDAKKAEIQTYGVAGLLTKPINQPQLVQTVARVLG